MDKAAVRRKVRQALAGTSVEQLAAWSAELVRRIERHPWFISAQSVLLFAALPSEPNLLPLLDSATSAGKWFCFPRVAGSILEIRRASTPDDFLTGPFGIREPDPARCPEVNLSAIDLALVPGLAFDQARRHRLGRGGGYYDRLLARSEFRAFTIGVCFPPQIVEDLVVEAHDRSVDAILSPEKPGIP